MRKLNQSGSLLLPLVIVLVLLAAAVVFATWAFTGRQDYKNKSDTKVATAVKNAVADEDKKKDAEFAEQEKSPVKTYIGPVTYGTLTFNYPKTWNQYVSTETTTLTINNFFNPDYVPDLASGLPYALRVQVSNQTYANALKTFESAAKAGTSVVAAYRLPKMPNVLGSMITGEISGKKAKGILVMLPLRDKTVILWTEGTNNTTDFTNIVLPSVTYVP